MNLPEPPCRTLAVVSAAGAGLGLIMLTPLLLQGSRFRTIDQLALLLVMLIYGYGIWSAVQSLKARPGWQRSLAAFWVAQVPAISSSFLTFTLSCGAGAWIYVRFGQHGLGAGAAGYLGSGYQWSYLVPKSELHLGINVVAVLVSTWLLASYQASPKPSPASNAA